MPMGRKAEACSYVFSMFMHVFHGIRRKQYPVHFFEKNSERTFRWRRTGHCFRESPTKFPSHEITILQHSIYMHTYV